MGADRTRLLFVQRGKRDGMSRTGWREKPFQESTEGSLPPEGCGLRRHDLIPPPLRSGGGAGWLAAQGLCPVPRPKTQTSTLQDPMLFVDTEGPESQPTTHVAEVSSSFRCP